MRFCETSEKFGYKKTKLQDVFENFLASGMEQAEVLYDDGEYASNHTLYGSLYEGAKKWAGDSVSVVMKRGRVYLVRRSLV